MRLVIFGSRTCNPTPQRIRVTLEELGIDESKITEVVCGMARGADLAGLRYAAQTGIPVKKFPADWDRYGRRAGILRNAEMAEYADVGVGFWDGESRGTAHMIETLRGLGKRVEVVLS